MEHKHPVLRRIVSLFCCISLMVGILAPMNVVFAADETNTDESSSFAAMRKKFYDLATGGSYDPEDPAMQPVLEKLNASAQSLWDQMNKNPVSNAVNGSYLGADGKVDPSLDSSQDYLFEEYPLGNRGTSGGADSNYIHQSLMYIRVMATAYQTKGCDLYHN